MSEGGAGAAQQPGFDPRSLGDLYPWTPRRLTLPGGLGLSYLDEGPPDAPPMLMVHGNPTWSFYYRELVRTFAGPFRCVVPDHIGHGLSDKPQRWDYTLARHVDNLEQLCDSLVLRDVTLVVHDWGGAIGMGWAVRHPERVRRLVVLNTAAFRSQRIPPSIDLCRVPYLGDLLIRGLNGFARAAQVRAVARYLPDDVRRGYLGPYGSWADRVGHLRFVQDIPMHSRIPSWEPICRIEQALHLLREKPMLICWGGRDFCFDDTFLEEWRRRFPAAEVHRFADAGHYVLEDAGPEVIARMQAFFARHPLAGTSAGADRAVAAGPAAGGVAR